MKIKSLGWLLVEAITSHISVEVNSAPKQNWRMSRVPKKVELGWGWMDGNGFGVEISGTGMEVVFALHGWGGKALREPAKQPRAPRKRTKSLKSAPFLA